MYYNESYINDFNVKYYEKYLNDPRLLNYLIEDEINRYNDKGNKNNFTLFRESLNHYVVKKIKSNPSFIQTREFNNYINFALECSKLNYDSFTNVFWRSFSPDELKKMMSKDQYDYINKIRESNAKNINTLFEKIETNKLLTQEELNDVCRYFGKRRDYADKKFSDRYKKLIKYIFNYAPLSGMYKLSDQVLEAVVNFSPIVCNESLTNETRKGFSFFNIRPCISSYDTIGKEISSGMGVSSNNFVFINRSLTRLNLNSFSDSNYSYLKKGNDITFLFIVLFHELTHNLQRNNTSSKMSLDRIISGIVNDNGIEYKKNHDSDEIEIDATAKGWTICKKFYEEYLFSNTNDKFKNDCKNELIRNCDINKFYTLFRSCFTIKEDSNNRKLRSEDCDFFAMSDAIKKNPNLLVTYPQLRDYFNNDGSYNLNTCFKQNVIALSNFDIRFCSFILKNKQSELMRMCETKNNDEKFALFYNMYLSLIRMENACRNVLSYGYKLGEYKKKEEFCITWMENVIFLSKACPILKETYDYLDNDKKNRFKGNCDEVIKNLNYLIFNYYLLYYKDNPSELEKYCRDTLDNFSNSNVSSNYHSKDISIIVDKCNMALNHKQNDFFTF